MLGHEEWALRPHLKSNCPFDYRHFFDSNFVKKLALPEQKSQIIHFLIVQFIHLSNAVYIKTGFSCNVLP